jgi:hypothetical protein
MDYLEMMRGAGLGDVLIPKKEFVKEHERLVKLLNQSDIPALRKEAKDQQAELAKEGGSGKSNFIARLMAEQKYKHRDASERDKPYEQTKTGKYRKPVMDPEVDDTKMSQAIKFDYNKIANKKQTPSGTNAEAYGASPFIAYHFGHATIPRKPRETAAQTAARRGFTTAELRKDDVPEPAKRIPASEKRKVRREKQSAAAPPKSMAEIIREKKEKAARPSESNPKGYLSSSPSAPLVSRPAHISKGDWTRYLKSKTYRDLLAQREFEAEQRNRD